MNEKDYKLAKSSYQKASGIKPTESYPKDQIAKVDELMADAAKVEQEYSAAIKKGEDALGAGTFDEAKVAFKEASGIKPDEEYPKNKIKEIDELIAKRELKEKEYQDKIKEADNALAGKKYDEAKSSYESASQMKLVKVIRKIR